MLIGWEARNSQTTIHRCSSISHLIPKRSCTSDHSQSTETAERHDVGCKHFFWTTLSLFDFKSIVLLMQMEKDLTLVLDWYESEPSIWVAIITGSGRAFCAGQDLKGNLNDSSDARLNSFGGISVRRMTKALVAALNRLALGGGAEIVMNCDVVIGHQGGILGFPEVRRGMQHSSGVHNIVILFLIQLILYRSDCSVCWHTATTSTSTSSRSIS